MTEALKCIVKGTAMMFSGPFPPNKRDYSFHTDREAIASDWKAVGLDMRNALSLYEKGHDVEEQTEATAK